MKKCKYCHKEFEPKNPKGKFCSDKCRVYASRVVKSTKSVIDYNPPPIFTSKENIEKVNQAFRNKETPPPVVAKNAPPMPKREDFSDSWEFIEAKNNWKKLYNL